MSSYLNSSDTSKIVEIIGIIAVVGSLLFVGFEISQNSRIAIAESQQNFSEKAIDLSNTVSSNPELAELVVLAGLNQLEIESMTPSQAGMLSFYYQAVLYLWESLYDSVQSGVLPDSEIDVLKLSPGLDSDYFRLAWARLKLTVNADFAIFLETLDWNKSRQ